MVLIFLLHSTYTTIRNQHRAHSPVFCFIGSAYGFSWAEVLKQQGVIGMAKKRLDGKAKQQVDSAMRRRHDQPALAAKHLREVLGYMDHRPVWAEVQRINPDAVPELQAILRIYHSGQPA
jgi:hypothetical protein